MGLALVQHAVKFHLDGLGARSGKLHMRDHVAAADPLGILGIHLVSHIHVHLDRRAVILGKFNIPRHRIRGDAAADFEFDGVPFLHRGLGSTRFLLKKGGTMGDIYSTIDLVRDANGAIYVDETQAVATSSIKDKEDYIKLGSVLPAGNLAWNNSFKWKNLAASFMINARLGGKVFSRTQAVLDYYGVSQATADARDQGFVQLNNGDRVSPQMWYSTIAGGTAVPQYYIYAAKDKFPLISLPSATAPR